MLYKPNTIPATLRFAEEYVEIFRLLLERRPICIALTCSLPIRISFGLPNQVQEATLNHKIAVVMHESSTSLCSNELLRSLSPSTFLFFFLLYYLLRSRSIVHINITTSTCNKVYLYNHSIHRSYSLIDKLYRTQNLR